MQKIAEEAKRRGLKNAAPKDELNKRLEEKKMSNKETIQKALERAIELKADPRVIELLKAQLNTSKENEMNKCNAMKRKILDSTYSNSVKVKALKKVMENAGSDDLMKKLGKLEDVVMYIDKAYQAAKEAKGIEKGDSSARTLVGSALHKIDPLESILKGFV
jgi:hypothetical protein